MYKGHETSITWICSVCNEKFQTREEVGDHQRQRHDDSFEKFFSFLARNMGDVFEVSSTVNDHEIPQLESRSQNLNDDIIEHQEDEVGENSSRKRKCIDEILSV